MAYDFIRNNIIYLRELRNIFTLIFVIYALDYFIRYYDWEDYDYNCEEIYLEVSGMKNEARNLIILLVTIFILNLMLSSFGWLVCLIGIIFYSVKHIKSYMYLIMIQEELEKMRKNKNNK